VSPPGSVSLLGKPFKRSWFAKRFRGRQLIRLRNPRRVLREVRVRVNQAGVYRILRLVSPMVIALNVQVSNAAQNLQTAKRVSRME
jgi:hypothetical protein